MVSSSYGRMVRRARWRAVARRVGSIAGKVAKVGLRAGTKVVAPLGAAYEVYNNAEWAARQLGKLKNKKGYRVSSAGGRKTTAQKVTVISRHNDMTIHSLGSVSMPGAGKTIKNASRAKFMYRNMNQVIVGGLGTAGQGRQSSNFCECIMTRQMLIGDTSVNRFDRFRLPDDIYKLNPYSVRPTNDIYPNAPPESGVDAGDVIGLRNVVSELGLLSMTTTPQIVDIYWVTPRYDTFDTPGDTWASALDAYRLGQNFSSNSTLPSTVIADSGAAAFDNWGDNPWKYSQFKKLWVSLKHQKIVMQPGDQRTISLNIVYNKVFGRKTFNEIRESACLAGITVFPFIIARAGLVGIKENAQDVHAVEVSYGAAKIGVVHNTVYNFAGLEVNRFKTSRVYKGIIESTGGVQQEIDDEDKVDVVEEN